MFSDADDAINIIVGFLVGQDPFHVVGKLVVVVSVEIVLENLKHTGCNFWWIVGAVMGADVLATGVLLLLPLGFSTLLSFIV